MDRFQERTAREESEPNPATPYDCWECGDPCAELTQAPWTARWLLVGPCCLPVDDQLENEVTPEELAALDAEELAIFGPRKPIQHVNLMREVA